MKKKTRKILELFCAILIATSVLAACSTGAPNARLSSAPVTLSPSTPSTSSASSADTGNSSSERVPITIMSADYNRVTKEDNLVVDEIGKQTGTAITTNIVPTAEYLQKISLYIASDTLPDIVRFNSYDHFSFISTDTLLELSQYLPDYPTLKRAMPDVVWDLVTVDSKIYTVPSYNYPGKYSFYMRKDWLDNLGLQVPTSTEELRVVLKAFTFDDPDKNGKNDTVGLGTEYAITDVRTNSFMPMFGYFGMQPTAYYEKDGRAYNPALTEQYKQALDYCRTLYAVDKSVDQDIFIIQGDQAKHNIANGKVGTAKGWWNLICETMYDQLKMDEIVPGAEWIVVNEIEGPNGDYGMASNDNVSFSTSISAHSPHIGKCLELLNYLATDEGFMMSSYGIKDVHYTVDANGEFADRTEEGAKAMTDKWLDILSQIVYRVDFFQNIQMKVLPNYAPYIMTAREGKMYSNMFEGISTPESQKYKADLDKLMLDWFVKFVTGKEPMDKFPEYVAEYKAKGGDIVLESYINEYNARRGANITAGN
jgi:putative aldouronate transport system substrate-binding protein